MDRRFVRDGRAQHERLRDGDHYIADDPVLIAEMTRAAVLCQRFNSAPAEDAAGQMAILKELLGAIGEGSVIRPPFYCDYGHRVRMGARCFANFGLVALDVAAITIGDDVLIGPSVQLLTPTHPIEPGPRREKWESAEAITLEDNVWLGGGVIVCPGVRIGRNTVVGAGSVVTRDLPADVVAVGNPARVIRAVGLGR